MTKLCGLEVDNFRMRLRDGVPKNYWSQEGGSWCASSDTPVSKIDKDFKMARSSFWKAEIGLNMG